MIGSITCAGTPGSDGLELVGGDGLLIADHALAIDGRLSLAISKLIGLAWNRTVVVPVITVLQVHDAGCEPIRRDRDR